MITADLLDAGTYPLLNPATYPAVSGMDSIYYNEVDFEEDGVDPRPGPINEAVRDAGEFELRPWPLPFLNHCWIDHTTRYHFDGDDGLQFELHRFDRLTGNQPYTPAGEVKLEPHDVDYLAETDATDARLVRNLTWKEVQDRAVTPAEWLRLDVINRAPALTDLGDPVYAMFRGLRANEFRLTLPDQSLFAPFDLTHPERYRVETDDGEPMTTEDGIHAMTLKNGGSYRLYLRPRKWRFVVTVVVHYAHITAFEYFIAEEIFTRAYTNRPPFFPIRHDLLHTSKNPSIPNFFGQLRSLDAGISWQFDHSRASKALREEIMSGQIIGKLYSKIFAGNEMPDIIVSSRPADANDVVLGIGRIDRATGRESRVWIIQNQDLTHVYPWELLGAYITPWFVAAEELFDGGIY